MHQTIQQWKKVKSNMQSRFPNLKSTFDSIDKKKNGTIDIEEFTQELQSNHGITSSSQILQIFNFINSSNNSEITREQFEKVWMFDDTQLSKQEQEHQNQKQQIKTYLHPQKSITLTTSGTSQQFSNLFDSYKSNNSPTKYINIQGDFTINQFSTPPILDKTVSPLKVISPPKLEQQPKIKQDAKDNKFKEMQRQITSLFNYKNEQQNTIPLCKSNFDGFLNTIKLGGSKKTCINNTSKTKSPFLCNQISLQNYAFQFNDMKMQFNSKYNGEKTNNVMKTYIYNKK
ncbi:unnamed protein product [Paramecium sonneborni]|uniref:EF-hand domain-containing protein n=1 Tax=Paramecium sonneborni TaxID=65129 RepID=A0A8S1L5W6_9CILI|nr:unnamed protein product [Paramecium sonneborni]